MLTFFIILAIIAALVAATWFIIRSISNYHHSEKFLQKERERLTTYSDVKILAKENNLPPEFEKGLWELCKVNQVPNIRFFIKDTLAVTELLKNHYFKLKEQKASAQDINNFFNLQYKVEQITAKTKRLRHTKQIPDNSIIFYVSAQGEQSPFQLIKKTKEALCLEVPESIIKRNKQPKLLERNRYIYKTSDGLSYTFVTRPIRFEKSDDGKNYMLIAHSEKLLTEVQRHYKREFLSSKCSFSAIKLNSEAADEENQYIFSEKSYNGELTNISGGGCCIKTTLPIKEKQHLNVNLEQLGIKETVIGLIRKTRKLPDGNYFALHIQFIELTIETQNKILAYVYKYEI